MSLPGVGEKLAQRIEQHRAQHGPFLSVEELQKVPGIGPAILERLRPWVQLDESKRFSFYPDPQPLRVDPAPKVSAKKPLDTSPTREQGTINVNTATLDELQKLPAIGPKLSQRIIEERAKRFFETAEDLDRVPGIGKKTVDKVRPFVTFGER